MSTLENTSRYSPPSLPETPMEEIEKCLNCPYPSCINCLDPRFVPAGQTPREQRIAKVQAQVQQYYDRGLNDREISEMMHLALTSVRKHRIKMGLPSHAELKREGRAS